MRCMRGGVVAQGGGDSSSCTLYNGTMFGDYIGDNYVVDGFPYQGSTNDIIFAFQASDDSDPPTWYLKMLKVPLDDDTLWTTSLGKYKSYSTQQTLSLSFINTEYDSATATTLTSKGAGSEEYYSIANAHSYDAYGEDCIAFYGAADPPPP